ncbi:hypothetical protein D0Y65_006813 [Glycine soja]|uniref:Ubiquitin-like protease family profile domain-containing protein n=1 Tax=Glycine soja TaxID=3848 RepID=A0A445L9Z9_GLYSO|nr:hypothetical protein D0Y65_006813 [Glycine soja]
MCLLSMCLHQFDGEFHVADFRAHWQLLVLCPRENIIIWFCSIRRKPDVHIKFAVNNAMKEICSNLQGKDNAPPPPPQWIEAKSHVQQGPYECGYYVMHWMWCIVSAGLKNELHNYFSDGTALDTDTMTTIRKKWAAYLLEVGKWM